MIIKTINNSIPIPAENSFLLPEGTYRAKLSRVFRKRKLDHRTGDSVEKIRLLFDILNYSTRNKSYSAGKTYDPCLAKGSQLREDLETWKVFKIEAGESTSSFDLDKLVGDEADIRVRHITNRTYPDPFVFIEEIRPAGTLIDN